MTTARAVRWHAAGDIRLETVDIPPPGEGEVLLAVAYCGVCGSDLHEIAHGPHAIPVGSAHPLSGSMAPITLGHEFSGTVVSVGPGVDDLPLGMRVAVEPNYRCGTCIACREGRYEVCTGSGFAGLMGDGGMAEYAVVPEYMVRRLPDDFDLAAAAVLEPAAVALHGIRRSTFAAGQVVLVVGLGPVGLLVCALLREKAAAIVIGVDPRARRRELAKELGADLVLSPDDDVAEAVRQATDGEGVHVAFEVVGSQHTFDLARAGLRSGGELLLLGLVDELVVPAFRLLNDEQTITTSVGYRDCHDELIALCSDGRLDLAALVTDVVGLAEAPDALMRMATEPGDGVKTLIHCQREATMSWKHELFEGRTVLVTGGTSGIGAGAAVRFAELAADVLAVGLGAQSAHVPVHERVRVVELDVTDAEAVSAFMSGVTALDVLLCCAGISRDRDEYDLDVFAQVLAVNLGATMRMAEAARPLLAVSRGSVVTTASMYSYFGAADRPAYSASKGGIAQLTRSLAAEYADDGIRVNAIAPGWIDTPLSKGLQADHEASSAVLARLPMHRWGTPADVADAYVFLASPAAAYVTGIVLPVDGGYLTI